jgi:hypothetical protein
MIFGMRPTYAGTVVNMLRCWSCNKNGVNHSDDLGLCPDCIERMRDPEAADDGKRWITKSTDANRKVPETYKPRRDV